MSWEEGKPKEYGSIGVETGTGSPGLPVSAHPRSSPEPPSPTSDKVFDDESQPFAPMRIDDSNSKDATDNGVLVEGTDYVDPPESPHVKFIIFHSATLTFLLTFSRTILIPVIPRLLLKVFKNDVGESARFLGYLQGGEQLLKFCVVALAGAMSDNMGRKSLMITSWCMTFVATIVLALINDVYWPYIFHYGVFGLSDFVAPLALAVMTDITPERKEAALSRRFSRMLVGNGCGIVLGPVMGAFLSKHSLIIPIYIATGAAGLGLLLALVMKETLPRPKSFTWEQTNPFEGIRVALGFRRFKILAAPYSCFWTAEAVRSTAVLYATVKFSWDSTTFGIFFLLVGVGAVSVLLAVPLIVPRLLSEKQCLIGGSILTSLGHLAWGLAYKTWMVFMSLPVVLAAGLLYPTMFGTISSGADVKDRQGALQGAVRSLQLLVSGIGEVIYGVLLGEFLRDVDSDTDSDLDAILESRSCRKLPPSHVLFSTGVCEDDIIDDSDAQVLQDTQHDHDNEVHWEEGTPFYCAAGIGFIGVALLLYLLPLIEDKDKDDTRSSLARLTYQGRSASYSDGKDRSKNSDEEDTQAAIVDGEVKVKV